MRCLFFSPRKNVGGFISPSDAGRAEGILVGRWGEGGGEEGRNSRGRLEARVSQDRLESSCAGGKVALDDDGSLASTPP